MDIDKHYSLMQLINEKGESTKEHVPATFSEDLAKSFYHHMLRMRTFDRSAKNLQRQGRIGTYALMEGQEAAQVGSALALRKEDWLFPTYRDHGAMLTYGADVVRVLLYWKGRTEGSFHPGKRIFPPAVPIATQLPHAVGAAWAEQRKGTRNAAIAYFGDGATSEGDFHEGMNFASVFQTPVVFFNQNNGYAISVPVDKQMNSKTIAQKSAAYDLPGIRVDGNDVLAVYMETKKALERARTGGGPTLIEAVTQRFGAHTTADDPSKYRDQAALEKSRDKLDPLLRLERCMKGNGYWDQEWAARTAADIKEEMKIAIEAMEAYPDPHIDDLFDYVFKDLPWPVAEQKEAYLSWMRREKA
ncbi:pyruvate dehydrogenase (acetyl-transferring) E1 component subunit alpha [Bacillus piscicola]|uniref:pyruvate dehydrogenase (acetyl-transferring) E1 component subunit alpha n=1 Tax=Bacillus piscicola TaxID=1632684 RepID=UPI001F090D1B|nr:pyruvate dehydrogenase (acetyl-transferring) E1 component subunit alpha [Bacillus piscicola]